jgi:hypothetical protein
MKTKVRIRILLAVTLCLLVVVSANAVNARPASAQLVNENNKIWFSVTVTNYEVALQVADPAVGWRTLYIRDHNSARNNHPFDFYSLGNLRYRVLLSKVNGVYVNRQCGADVDFRTAYYNRTAVRRCY